MSKIQITSLRPPEDLLWLISELKRIRAKGFRCDIYKLKYPCERKLTDRYILIEHNPLISKDKLSAGEHMKTMKLVKDEEWQDYRLPNEPSLQCENKEEKSA